MPHHTLKRLILEGFRAYKQRQEFNLDRPSGLYFIQGINQAQPRLGSNGAGKSTICEAIAWVLYGKTVAKLFGKDLKNWHSKTCLVSLELLKDNSFHTITRTIAPNSLTLDSETIDQTSLDKFIGIGYEQFLYLVIAGQFNPAFVNLEPTPRLTLISGVMDLSFWDGCAEEARHRAASTEQKAQEVSSQLNRLRDQQTTENGSYTELLKSQEAFAREQELRTAVVLSKLNELKQEAESHTLEQARVRTLITARQSECRSVPTDIARIQENITCIDKDLAALLQTLGSLKGSKEALVASFNRWKEMPSQCPTCDQSISKELTTSHKLGTTREILETDKSIKRHEKLLTNLNEQHQFNQTKLEEIRSIGQLNDRHIVSLQLSLERAKSKLDSIQKEIQQSNQALAELEVQVSPYENLLKASIEKSKSITKQIADLEPKESQLQKDLLGNSFWVKGFKELKLWAVADALGSLELECRNAAEKLGLVDWSYKFPIEKETSTGDIAKGLHVLIHPPGFPEEKYLPFTTWCGGESQRLKLASINGLSNLIRDQKGVDFNIRVYDEPTSFLSDQGIEDLLNLLKEQALETDKVIYLIDQRGLQFPEFAGIITISNEKESVLIKG